MPFILIIAGIILLTVAVRNTQDEFFYLIQGDFTGPNNYVYWVLAILVIGAIGYVPRLKPISNGFLILVVLVLVLKRGTGLYDSFNTQLKAGTAKAVDTGKSWLKMPDGTVVKLPLSDAQKASLGL